MKVIQSLRPGKFVSQSDEGGSKLTTAIAYITILLILVYAFT